VPTQSWRGKSAVFRIYTCRALTSNGYRKSIKAVRRQRNLGLPETLPKNSNFSSCSQNIKLKNNTTYNSKLRTVFVSATEHCFIFIWKKYRLEFRFRSRDFSFNLFPVWQPSCWRFWSAIVPIHTSTINGITYLVPPSCLCGILALRSHDFWEMTLTTKHVNPFRDSKPELFSDIVCLRIPYQPCIVLFRNFFQVPPPQTGVNYACTSMSCQPALEYSKVDIFCCMNM
jgi:hypothetical protein